jgi:RND family efflux transporter MFP subunit
MKKLYLLLILLFFGCTSQKEDNGASSSSIPVMTVRPVVRDVGFSIESIGTLHPFLHAEIFPQTEGHVVEVCVSEGQYVTKGSPLFRVDPTAPTILVHKAEAEHKKEQAEADALQKKLARYSRLAQKDLIAQTEWEDLESQIAKSKQSLQLTHLCAEEAQLALDGCTVQAPFDGRVGKIQIAPGVFVAKAASCTAITQVDPLIIECSVTEKELSQIPKDQRSIEVSPLASPTIVRAGAITFFDTCFDEKKGLLLVRGTIPNADPSATLHPGQVVLAKIPFKVERQAVLVPQKAIRYNTKGPYVYIVKDGTTVEVQQVVLGEECGDERIVKQGVTAEADIVADGLLRLSAGCIVTIVSPQ